MEHAPALRGIRKRIGQNARRRASIAEQATQRTAGFGNNRFLKHRFAPFYAVSSENAEAVQQGFFASLKNLCALYGWALPDVSAYAYPENISMAFAIVQQKCKQEGLAAIIAKDKTRNACLATAKTYEVGYMLYYIPVRPFWRLLRTGRHKALLGVFTAIFSYLVKVVRVPYYRNDCYLFNL